MNYFYYSSGGYDIIDSGILYSFKKDDDIEYNMDIVAIKNPEVRFKMKIVFQFEDDGKEIAITRTVKNDVVYFKCYNFNNNLGSGTTEPIEVAMVAERRIYIHLWAFLLGKDTRKIEYTLYFERAGEGADGR